MLFDRLQRVFRLRDELVALSEKGRAIELTGKLAECRFTLPWAADQNEPAVPRTVLGLRVTHCH